MSLDLWTRTAARWLPLAGCLLMLLGAVFAIPAWRASHTGVRAVATVEQVRGAVEADGRLHYTTRLSWRSASGLMHQAALGPSTDDAEFTVGQTLPILYAPSRPQTVRIVTVWRVYGTSIVACVAGIVLFDIGWVLRLMLRRKA